jgi:hypothetical protein
VHARRNVFITGSDSFCKHFSGAASTQSQNSLTITVQTSGDLLEKSTSEEESDSEDDVNTASHSLNRIEHQWRNNSFAGPLKLLENLSGYPNLYVLYSILCCLPVSKASAERALSKLKIIKSRLRTSLSDSTMSALMVLAAESDIMAAITNHDIISRMCASSPSLKSQLIF